MAALPKNVQTDKTNVKRQADDIEEYIKYMRERLDFAFSQTNKRIDELQNEIEAIKEALAEIRQGG